MCAGQQGASYVGVPRWWHAKSSVFVFHKDCPKRCYPSFGCGAKTCRTPSRMDRKGEGSRLPLARQSPTQGYHTHCQQQAGAGEWPSNRRLRIGIASGKLNARELSQINNEELSGLPAIFPWSPPLES